MTRINITEIWERHGYKVEHIERAWVHPSAMFMGLTACCRLKMLSTFRKQKRCATSASSINPCPP